MAVLGVQAPDDLGQSQNEFAWPILDMDIKVVFNRVGGFLSILRTSDYAYYMESRIKPLFFHPPAP